MAWRRLLALEALPVGTAVAVTADLDDLLVCRTAEGSVHVVPDVCSHDEAPLGAQDLDGPVVSCPRHGARFDVTSGRVLKGPAVVGLDRRPCRIVDGWIEADLED